MESLAWEKHWCGDKIPIGVSPSDIIPIISIGLTSDISPTAYAVKQPNLKLKTGPFRCLAPRPHSIQSFSALSNIEC